MIIWLWENFSCSVMDKLRSSNLDSRFVSRRGVHRALPRGTVDAIITWSQISIPQITDWIQSLHLNSRCSFWRGAHWTLLWGVRNVLTSLSRKFEKKLSIFNYRWIAVIKFGQQVHLFKKLEYLLWFSRSHRPRNCISWLPKSPETTKNIAKLKAFLEW